MACCIYFRPPEGEVHKVRLENAGPSGGTQFPDRFYYGPEMTPTMASA